MPRPIEFLIALVALVLLAPVIAVTLLVSLLALRASPVFTQTRLGRDEVPFTIYKVRTLPVTASAVLDKHQLRDVEIPPAARMLRRLHLDELIQLVNVVNGSMSLVGPRPEMPHLVEKMPDSQRVARRALLPGMTGLWQVSVAASGLMFEHPEYDEAYAGLRSVGTDIRLALRTVTCAFGVSQPVDAAELDQLLAGRRLAVIVRPDELVEGVEA